MRYSVNPQKAMEINDLKPDFEKIACALNFDESIKKQLSLTWESMEKGEIPYEVKDNINLKALLEEFNLESFYNDFLFLAYYIKGINAPQEDIREKLELISKKNDELVFALKILLAYKENALKIDIKHKKENISTSITSNKLIQVIKESLLEYFSKTPLFFQQGIAEMGEKRESQDWKEYWKEYIDFIISEKQKVASKKGRKKQIPLMPIYIIELQRYLQEYTEIKAEEGISISRRQSLFIFKFLSLIGIIQYDKLYWKEDNIRLILTKFRKEIKNYKILNS
jgi:hypothetical protein